MNTARYQVHGRVENGMAIVVAAGDFNIADFLLGWRSVLEMPGFVPGMPIIADVIDVENRLSGLEAGKKVLMFIKNAVGPQPYPWPMAIVGTGVGMQAYFKTLTFLFENEQAICGGEPLNVRTALFPSIEKAIEWIRREYPNAIAASH